jgi:hypothetical protein
MCYIYYILYPTRTSLIFFSKKIPLLVSQKKDKNIMAPRAERSPLDPEIFHNYLGVVLSHYCPAFLPGQTDQEIHRLLEWGLFFLNTDGHNCFYWPCWTFKICPTTEKPPEPLNYCGHWHCVYCDCPNFIQHTTPIFP